jgi:hypothetical protein
MNSRILRMTGIAVLVATTTTMAQSPKRLEFPGDVPGPPIYAQISDVAPFGPEYYHTDDWAAVVFHRDPTCVPPGYNLLDGFDIPDVFACALTIQGFEVWLTPPPQGEAPVEVRGWGLGAVPIYFVSWHELQAAVADHVLTIAELQELASLRIGLASFFSLGIRPGLQTLPGVEMSARGVLQDGQQFLFQATAGGRSIEPKHVRIEFW